jgi:hypothetical protein
MRQDVAAALRWPSATASALRAMLPSALSVVSSLSLWWLGAYDEIRLSKLKALQSSDQSLLLEDGPSSHSAVTFRSEAIRQAVASATLA